MGEHQPGLFADDARALSRHPNANRELRLGDALVAYEFKRGRRRTIGLSVGPQGLSVRAPSWTLLAEVDALVRRKADWVLAKLREAGRRQPLAPQAIEWRDGAEIPYLGRPLRLAIDPGPGRAGAVLEGDRLRLALAHDAGEQRLRDLVQAWLMREARRVFVERLDHYAPRRASASATAR